jgi:hypothetical protein
MKFPPIFGQSVKEEKKFFAQRKRACILELSKTGENINGWKTEETF